MERSKEWGGKKERRREIKKKWKEIKETGGKKDRRKEINDKKWKEIKEW